MRSPYRHSVMWESFSFRMQTSDQCISSILWPGRTFRLTMLYVLDLSGELRGQTWCSHPLRGWLRSCWHPKIPQASPSYVFVDVLGCERLREIVGGTTRCRNVKRRRDVCNIFSQLFFQVCDSTSQLRPWTLCATDLWRSTASSAWTSFARWNHRCLRSFV